MNNTHALLLAFIEASGYEVEEVRSIDETSYHAASAAHGAMVDGMLSAGVPCYKQYPIMANYLSTDYKITKKVNKVDDDLEAVTHLMKEFKKGTHEIMTMVYNGKTYTYNDKGELTINENL